MMSTEKKDVQDVVSYRYMKMEPFDIESILDKAEDEKIPLPHKADKKWLSNVLTDQFLKVINPDVVLKQGENMVPCHGDVLRYNSELFANGLPTGSVVLLPFDKVHPTVFPMIYQWMLKESIECPLEHLLKLLEAGHYLFMPKLVNEIFNYMDEKKALSPLDAIDIYFEAKEKNKLGIAKLALKYLHKYFLMLINTKEYGDMNLICLYDLLISDNLYVQTEIEVFYAIITWLYVDIEERKIHLKRLITTLRFQFLPSPFLIVLAMNISDMHPHIAKILGPKLHNTMWGNQKKAMEFDTDDSCYQRKRIWIRDPNCPYKDDLDKGAYIDYGAFKSYIDTLENADKFINSISENPDYAPFMHYVKTVEGSDFMNSLAEKLEDMEIEDDENQESDDTEKGGSEEENSEAKQDGQEDEN